MIVKFVKCLIKVKKVLKDIIPKSVCTLFTMIIVL